MPVLACMSLLAVQLGGLHMHVDADGNVGGVKGVDLHVPLVHSHDGNTHVHLPDTPHHEHPGDPEHAGDNDISVIEMRSGKSKLTDFTFNLHLRLAIHRVLVEQVRPIISEPQPITRKSRWRPPQRAPPAIS